MRTRIFCLAPAMVTIPVYACVHAYTYTWNCTYACVHVYVKALANESRTRLAYGTRLAYTVYAYTSKCLRLRRLRLLVRACADDRTYVRTYIRTYIQRIDSDLYCLALMRSAITYICHYYVHSIFRSYPVHDSANILLVRSANYHKHIESVREWYSTQHHNWLQVDGERSQWWVWEEAKEKALTSARQIQYYLARITSGTYTCHVCV